MNTMPSPAPARRGPTVQVILGLMIVARTIHGFNVG